MADAETGGHYTVKVFESRTADGSWAHASITLRPDTTFSGYEAKVFERRSGELTVVDELLAVNS